MEFCALEVKKDYENNSVFITDENQLISWYFAGFFAVWYRFIYKRDIIH